MMSAALAERYFLEYENFYDAAANAFPARNYIRKHNFPVDFSQFNQFKTICYYELKSRLQQSKISFLVLYVRYLRN